MLAVHSAHRVSAESLPVSLSRFFSLLDGTTHYYANNDGAYESYAAVTAGTDPAAGISAGHNAEKEQSAVCQVHPTPDPWIVHG